MDAYSFYLEKKKHTKKKNNIYSYANPASHIHHESTAWYPCYPSFSANEKQQNKTQVRASDCPSWIWSDQTVFRLPVLYIDTRYSLWVLVKAVVVARFLIRSGHCWKAFSRPRLTFPKNSVFFFSNNIRWDAQLVHSSVSLSCNSGHYSVVCHALPTSSTENQPTDLTTLW